MERCGKLGLGVRDEQVVEERRMSMDTSWRLPSAVLLGGAALAVGGVGGAQLWLGSERRSRAEAAEVEAERNLFRRQADTAEEIGTWSLGLAAALAVASAALFVWDALDTSKDGAGSGQAQSWSMSFAVLPEGKSGSSGASALLEVKF